MSDLVNKNLEVTILDKVEILEGEFLKQVQVDCPVVHRFGPGTYIREVKIPSNTYAIGHHQNFEHINVFLKGRVSILNDDGSFTEMVAPMVFIGKPGRKVGYIHEEITWLNIYPTEETDVDKLEGHFVTKSATWLEANSEKIALLENHVNDEKEKLCQS